MTDGICPKCYGLLSTREYGTTFYNEGGLGIRSRSEIEPHRCEPPDLSFNLALWPVA